MRHKVLFVSSWYPTQQNKTHGIFVKRYAEAIALQQDVAVVRLCPSDDVAELRIESNLENNVYEVYVFFKRNKFNPLAKFADYKKFHLVGLDFVLKNWGKPDILQVNILFPAGIAGLEVSRKLKIPFVVSEHWTGYDKLDGSYKGVIRKYFTKLAAAGASAIITVTEDLKEKMIGHGLTGNYFVVPNVVNTSIFKYDPVKKAGRFRFLHVSSLDARQKNVEGIIDAFRRVYNHDQGIELYIIGDGENRRLLERRCGELLNRAVYFMGQKMDKELAAEFHAADSLVLFGNYENLPVVMLEALCCGIPVISSNVGGIAEWLNESNGILVEAKKTEQLVTAMKQVKNQTFDNAGVSRQACENFSYYRVASQFTEIYNTVLNKK